MWTSLSVLLTGAVLAAAAAFWVLRAYRRAGGGASSARPALGASAAVILVALGIYLFTGRPELPGAAYAERLEALKQRDPATYTAEEALVMWTEIAERYRDDPVPQLRRGEILLALGRAAEAARAYDSALRLDPRSVEGLLGMGRSVVAIEGAVTPDALAYFQQAGELSDDPTPWIYQAMAAMEQNREVDARRFWGEALTRMPADDPRREMAARLSRGD